MNESQAMALMLHGRGGALNGIEGRLKSAGISMNMLSETGIGALARINSGGADVLQAQAASLRARTGRDSLSADERKRLDTTMAGGDLEAQRQVLTELTATREQEMTEGKATRDSIEGVARETQKFATALVPVANTMRDALVAMAAKIAPDSEFGKAQKQYEALKARDAEIAASDDELNKWDDETEAIHKGAKYQGLKPGDRKMWDAERARMREQLVMRRERNLGADSVFRDQADSLIGSIMQAESGGDPNAVSSKGARGLMQIMPATGRNPGMGVKPLQDDSPEENMRFGRDYFTALLRRFNGDKSKALGAYNWGMGNMDGAIRMYGDDWLKYAPQETQGYVGKILGQGGSGKMVGEATVRLDIIDGKTNRQLATVDTKLKSPQASGTK